MMRSIWEDQTLPHFPALEGDTKTDVLILGGGIAGLLCAWQLRQRGVDYLLLEADRICGGVTKNTTAKITSQHGLIYHKLLEKNSEAALAYLRANENALAEYRRLCREIPCRFEEKPNFVYTTAHPEDIEAELMALQALGRPGEYDCMLPLPFSVKGAVKVNHQAQFQPLSFLAAIAEGLNIRENTPVRQLAKQSALTDTGRVEFRKLIVATHFPILNKHGFYFLKLYQHRSYVLSLANAPELNGMYVGDAPNSFSLRNFDGQLLIGCGGHRTGKPSPGWKPAMELARRRYPQAALTHRWAAQDCMSLDGMPYIGQYSRNTPHVYVATGFCKWGMTWSMAASQILADLVTDKPHDLAPFFSPSRGMLTRQLALNIKEATASLLSTSEKRCPHMGCALKWNPHERTWDCPCHGSRFTEKGKLLNDPATGDLKEK